jgi:hypothetical protein
MRDGRPGSSQRNLNLEVPGTLPPREVDGGVREVPGSLPVALKLLLALTAGRGRDSLSFARSKIVISACCSSTRGIATLFGWPRSLRRIRMIERASSDGGRG